MLLSLMTVPDKSTYGKVIDRFEIDAGQLGSPLLAGYEWL